MWEAAVAVLVDRGPWALLVAFPIAVVWAYATDRIVSRGRHAEMAEDRDYWRDTAMAALNLGEAVAGREDTS